MRLGLNFREMLQGAGGWVAEEFDSLIAAIQTGWNKEHKEDGTHGTVTADAVTVAGKLRVSGIVTYVAPTINPSARLDDVSVNGLQNASVLKIRNTVSSVTLTGIDSRGREPGDLLWVINDDIAVADPTDLLVEAFNTNSSLPNRFIGGVASTSPWTLHGSQMMLLMYDTYTNSETTQLEGWRVLMTA